MDNHSLQVAAQRLDYCSMMKKIYISNMIWWDIAKVHVEHQVDEICPEISEPTLGEILILEASKSIAVVHRSSDGSLPSSSGTRRSRTETH